MAGPNRHLMPSSKHPITHVALGPAKTHVSQAWVDDGNSTARPKSNFIGRQFPNVSAPCRFARQRLGECGGLPPLFPPPHLLIPVFQVKNRADSPSSIASKVVNGRDPLRFCLCRWQRGQFNALVSPAFLILRVWLNGQHRDVFPVRTIRPEHPTG